jgi:hypothetical protein
MTPRARTTLVVGVAAVGVLVAGGVVCWRPIVERYHAGRFANEELWVGERRAAADKLAEMGSPLLVDVAVSRLVSLYEPYAEIVEQDPPRELPAEFGEAVQKAMELHSTIQGVITKWQGRCEASYCDVLLDTVESGSLSERRTAGVCLRA